MSTVNDLLIACRQQGIVMATEGEALRVEGPGEALTEDLLRKLKEHKPELLAVLARETGLRGSGWRPWKPESDADIAEAVKEAEDGRAAILEFEGGIPRAEAVAQARAYAWHWKSDKYDPVTGAYGGTYICPHAEPETVRHELEAQFGGHVTELYRWDRTRDAAEKSRGRLSSGGFDSLTVKYEVVREFAERGKVLVLHIGDHDPSGVHLYGSLDEDVRAFLDALGGTAEFHRLAVIPEHIEAYNLPTAPPKATDNRNFYGQTVQAEALPPDTLASLTKAAIERNLDMRIYRKAVKTEACERDRLLAAMGVSHG